MADKLGTRRKQTVLHNRIEGSRLTRNFTRDLGMTKLVTASLTFGGGAITGANGTFTGTFAVGDPVFVEAGGAVNNGLMFTVTALDGANNAFLTVDPPPAAETVSCTVRTQ